MRLRDAFMVRDLAGQSRGEVAVADVESLVRVAVSLLAAGGQAGEIIVGYDGR